MFLSFFTWIMLQFNFSESEALVYCENNPDICQTQPIDESPQMILGGGSGNTPPDGDKDGGGGVGETGESGDSNNGS
ncbi:hypothetical protein [Pleionea sediminis]|uniref:hypothetical protein n=1 Tax=Pleionea sediminis TaxID=2569479 RepID=UPI001186F626|nr:hypothetical protein [Pleionea sediminis]